MGFRRAPLAPRSGGPYSGDGPVLVLVSLVSAVTLAGACSSDDRPPPPPQNADGASGTGGSAIAGGFAGYYSGSAGSAMSQGGSSGASTSGGGAGAGAGSGGSGASQNPPECIPREACQQLCSALGSNPSGCGVGDENQCPCICEQRFNGPCPNELDALLACAGTSPAIDCSVRGRVFPGCEAESFALQICDFRAREQLCARTLPRCTPYCEAATLGFCAQGPESVTGCLCGCEATVVARCEAEFDAFMTCSADLPQFTCDPDDGTLVPGACGAQWQTLDDCVNSRPDAGG